MALLKPGSYKAIPNEWGINKSPEKGTESIFVELLINGLDTDGKEVLEARTWYGYLTEKAKDRTIETIYKLGFNGDFEGLASGRDSKALSNVTEVMVTIAHENTAQPGPNNPNPTPVIRDKIQWINSIGETHGAKRLDKAEAMSIINKFKGDFVAKKPVGAKKTGLDLS